MIFFRADTAAPPKPLSGLCIVFYLLRKLMIWTAAYLESMPPVFMCEFWMIFKIDKAI
jgi:hypothetical protein